MLRPGRIASLLPFQDSKALCFPMHRFVQLRDDDKIRLCPITL